MRLILRFEFYSVDDLATLVRHHAQALRWSVDEAVFSLIAVRARGTPRLALRLLQSCRRVCRADSRTTITQPDLDRSCQLEQIDGLGLGPTEQKYLQILAGGVSRLNVLASMLGLPARTVSQVTEQFLIRAGLIIKDDQGKRQMTAKGREHLANVRSDSE
jgi:Holliday junction DNA helicase RuvB